MIWLLGCMSLDGFFFAGTPVSAYALGYEVIPLDQVEEVSFEGDQTLYGVWAHQSEEAPLLLYFHGNTGNIDDYWENVERFWGYGFETFIFDYRGFGRSEGDSSYDGVLSDGLAAVRYVEETRGLESTEFAYLGLSLGGFVSIHTALDKKPYVLITESMFASADQLADAGLGSDVPPGWFFQDPFDNTEAASKLTGVPYLIMHGEADDYIEVANGEAVFAAANEPKELWKVPDANHSTIPTTDPEGYEEHIKCWYLQEEGCPEALIWGE
jgi:fermentation-respiration switch protein FrsA (DUF1100 family)